MATTADALVHYSGKGDGEAVSRLLTDHAGAIDDQDFQGITPLVAAVRRRRSSMIDLLLSRNADPNAPCSDGNTPLHVAVSHGYLDLAQKLITAGADIDATNGHGQTALHVAAMIGRKDATDLLLTAKADPNVIDAEGHTPTAVALIEGEGEISTALQKAGASDTWSDRRKSELFGVTVQTLDDEGPTWRALALARLYDFVDKLLSFRRAKK